MSSIFSINQTYVKRILKKTLPLVMLFTVMISLLSVVITTASASTFTYDPDAAIAFAKNHCATDAKNHTSTKGVSACDYGWLCAEFVSECLVAGGFPQKLSSVAGLSGFAGQITNYGSKIASSKIGEGYVKMSTFAQTLSKGDPIVLLYGYGNGSGNGHIVLYSGETTSDGTLKVYAHNSRKQNEKLYASEKTVQIFAVHLSSSGSIATQPPSADYSSTNPDDYTYPTRSLTYMSPTMKGNDVAWVQAVLYQLGFSVEIDGSYGKGSVAAIKQFQTKYGLEVDGNCGPATRAKLLEVWNAKKHTTHTYSNACDTTCNVCGKTRTVPDHKWSNKYCGSGECTVCGLCRMTFHSYAEATCTKAKTCKECGLTSGSALGHKYSNDCDTSCNTCGAKRTITHDYAAATCNAPKTCKVCGATSGSALGHKYTNSCDTSCNTCGTKRNITHDYSAATCTKAKTCKVCGATSGSKLGHAYSNDCDKTCNRCNATRTVGAHQYSNACDKSCNECGTKRTIKHTYDHDCDTKCNVCGAKRSIKHDYETVTKKATLKKNGSTVKECTECGKETSKKTIKRVKTVKLSKTSYTYNGKTKKPTVTVKDSAGKTLKEGTDYTVTYAKGRKNVGTYKVTVKLKGKYSGTKVLTFKITPPKTVIKKVTPRNDALKVSIDKETKQVTGYQVQYSTSKTFKKATTKTVKSYKTTSLTLKKLKSDKKYYVRVRTYKTVDGTRYYSGWSSYKTARTK